MENEKENRESAATFPELDGLLASGAKAHLVSALTVVLENRPSNPLVVLAALLRDKAHPAPAQTQAVRAISLADPQSPNFLDNVAQAFCMLEADNAGGGVRGAQFNGVLRQLCNRLTAASGSVLFATLQVPEDADLPFKHFARNAHAACHVHEGLQQHADRNKGKGGASLLLASMLMTPLEYAAPREHQLDEACTESGALHETIRGLIAEGIQTVRKPKRTLEDDEQLDNIAADSPSRFSSPASKSAFPARSNLAPPSGLHAFEPSVKMAEPPLDPPHARTAEKQDCTAEKLIGKDDLSLRQHATGRGTAGERQNVDTDKHGVDEGKLGDATGAAAPQSPAHTHGGAETCDLRLDKGPQLERPSESEDAQSKARAALRQLRLQAGAVLKDTVT